ncbi:ArsR/SmtB family transcription factor [Bombilactobacillus apium]
MMQERGGICVQEIVKKAGLAQSTVSKYLSDLQDCGLLLSERHGKWTYYRRDEKNIQLLVQQLATEL